MAAIVWRGGLTETRSSQGDRDDVTAGGPMRQLYSNTVTGRSSFNTAALAVDRWVIFRGSAWGKKKATDTSAASKHLVNGLPDRMNGPKQPILNPPFHGRRACSSPSSLTRRRMPCTSNKERTPYRSTSYRGARALTNTVSLETQ